MGVASLAQPVLRRRSSIKALALMAVLSAAVLSVPLLRGHRGHHRHHDHAGWAPPPPLALAPCMAPRPGAPPAADLDACPAALAAWTAVRNLPDVPSGTTAFERARLRNQAIEACRTPHQP